MASRVAGKPISVPSGVDIKQQGQSLEVKGAKGTLSHQIHELVELAVNDNELNISPRDETRESNAQAGTARALINNIVVGVSEGFQKKLILKGVGYRAQMKGNTLHLTLGFSHPVEYSIPEGITIKCETQTDICVEGVDKQKVGQIAAEIRAFRPPEPYKGKGVRYADEVVRMKETKKK